MAKKQKVVVKYYHREDAEWLTVDICNAYRKKADKLDKTNGNDTGARRSLRMELQNRCDITETEAINILNGYGVDSYVKKYKRIKDIMEGNATEEAYRIKDIDKEFLDFLHERETTKKYNDYNFEEND